MSERTSRLAAAKAAKERGSALYAQQKWRDAADAFGEAIKIAPKDDEDLAIYRSNRAAAYLQLGDARSARRDAEQCIKDRPLWARGWSRLAAACEMLEDDAGAEKAYEKLVSLDADNVDARRSLSAVRERLANGQARGRGGGSAFSGWSMPSMPSFSMPSASDVVATVAAGAAMAKMRYDRMTPNQQLAVKCVMGVALYLIFTRVTRMLGFGRYGGGYYDYDDWGDYGSGFSLYSLLGIVALYYAHKSGASWWNLLSIAQMFGLTGGRRRGGYGGYGGYGMPYGGFGRGFGRPGMFF